jgi:hypothetical protein
MSSVPILVVSRARIDLEVLAGEPAEDHLLDAFEIKEAVLLGGLEGFQQGGARIVVEQAKQASEGQRGASGNAFFESLGVGCWWTARQDA